MNTTYEITVTNPEGDTVQTVKCENLESALSQFNEIANTRPSGHACFIWDSEVTCYGGIDFDGTSYELGTDHGYQGPWSMPG